MKAYLDNEDSYYRYNEESIKEELINVKVKSKKDYARIGAIIFTFTVLSIVIGLSIYTAWKIAYGQEEGQYSPDKQEMYLCVDMMYINKSDMIMYFSNTSTDKICKYWTAEEIKLIFGLK
jgi:hypothetical protein